jgi:hypothetical protein
MAVEPKPHLSVRDYLYLERRAETKNEYLDGLMVAMVGGSSGAAPARSIRAISGSASLLQTSTPIRM